MIIVAHRQRRPWCIAAAHRPAYFWHPTGVFQVRQQVPCLLHHPDLNGILGGARIGCGGSRPR
jgi:hypothetical protein